MNVKELQTELSEVAHFIETPGGFSTVGLAEVGREMPTVMVEVEGKLYEVTGVTLHNASRMCYLKVGQW